MAAFPADVAQSIENISPNQLVVQPNIEFPHHNIQETIAIVKEDVGALKNFEVLEKFITEESVAAGNEYGGQLGPFTIFPEYGIFKTVTFANEDARALNGFIFFEKLSDEMRAMIWRIFLSFRTRIVPMSLDVYGGRPGRSRLPLPTALQINKESRREALKVFELIFNESYNGQKNQLAYINVDLDTLLVRDIPYFHKSTARGTAEFVGITLLADSLSPQVLAKLKKLSIEFFVWEAFSQNEDLTELFEFEDLTHLTIVINGVSLCSRDAMKFTTPYGIRRVSSTGGRDESYWCKKIDMRKNMQVIRYNKRYKRRWKIADDGLDLLPGDDRLRYIKEIMNIVQKDIDWLLEINPDWQVPELDLKLAVSEGTGM